MTDHCEHLKELLEEQKKKLFEDPDFLKDKWYRSEEAGRDIGISSALIHFIKLPVGQEFFENFRKEYCSTKCEYRNDCEMGNGYMGLAKKVA